MKKKQQHKLFQQIYVREVLPKINGWYNTDKGILYYFKEEDEWSCRSDRISTEYPTFWYKEIKVYRGLGGYFYFGCNIF